MPSYYANDTINGYKIQLELNSAGLYDWTVNKPDGSELFRAGGGTNGRISSVQAAFTSLANKAADSGDDALANIYRNTSFAMSSVGPELVANVNDQYTNANPPKPPEPTPPPTTEEQTNQQNSAYVKSGGADEDSGKTSSQSSQDGTPNSSGTETTTATSPSTPPPGITPTQPTSGNVTSNAGTTPAGKAGTTASKNKPGKRLQNPLGDFSSYTYQISLYMITPDAYNAFIESGRKNINAIANVGSSAAAADYNNSAAGVYLVAQSGGINNKTSHRAPGFDLDYYIDNLEIDAAISGGKSNSGGGGSTNEVSVKFQIIEPYGFSFVSKLKQAGDELAKYSAILKKVPPEKLPASDRQNFILGIRFLGYDKDGNVVSGLERFAGTTQTSSSAPAGTGSFETYYDITFSEFTFKLDGKATIYNITAASTPTRVGMGLACGRLTSDTTVSGGTVEEALTNLVTQLNNQQKDLKLNIPNQYEVVYLGDDADLIKTASIVSKADTDKSKLPMLMDAITNKDITVKNELDAKSDVNKRVMTFKGGGAQSILQSIQQVVTQSSYIQNALKYLYTTDTTPDPKTDSYEVIEGNSKKVLKWINVSTEIVNLGFDTTKNDFSYKIRYLVQSYDTPIVTALSAGLTTPYYGPHKRYEYWLTGKNSEILRYEMAYNQLYLNVAVTGLTGNDNKTVPIPTAVGMKAEAPRQGKLGIGAEAQNAYVNYLTEPGAYAVAKVSILGDPDFLVQDNSSSLNKVYDKFYGSTGYNVSGNGGQVFIEIDFKEAVDYNNTTGTMDINNKILFVDYPDEVKKYVKGVSYQVRDVKSTFKGGKFEQHLECIVNTFAKDKSSKNDSSYDNAESARLSNYANKTPASTDPRTAEGGGVAEQTTPEQTKSTGLKPVEPVITTNTAPASTDAAPTNNSVDLAAAWYSGTAAGEITAPTGSSALALGSTKIVQDDDAISASIANTVIKPAEITIPETVVREEASNSTSAINTAVPNWNITQNLA